MPGLTLQWMEGELAVCRLAPDAAHPAWADAPTFSCITRTAEELSIICPSEQVPPTIQSERGWRGLKLCGPFPFTAVGIMAAVTGPLAQAGISVLVVGTFDTDYVLVKSERREAVRLALEAAGHTFRGP